MESLFQSLAAISDAREAELVALAPPTHEECSAICAEMVDHLRVVAKRPAREHTFRLVFRSSVGPWDLLAVDELPAWNKYIEGKGFPSGIGQPATMIKKWNEQIAAIEQALLQWWNKYTCEKSAPSGVGYWKFSW